MRRGQEHVGSKACWESPGSAEAEPEPSACIALGSTTKFTNPVSTEVIYLKKDGTEMERHWNENSEYLHNTQTLITLGYQMKI